MRKATLCVSITLNVLFLSACSDNDNRCVEQKVSEKCDQVAAPIIRHCFRNEYPIDDTMDFEELVVVVDGDHATGEYNWVAAYKDKRLGRFSGSFQDSAINANYEYQQEGASATTSISISLEEKQATVRGGPPELGLNLSLARVDC